MVNIVENFISDSENDYLSGVLDSKLKNFIPESEVFYKWFEIDLKDKLFDDLNFLRIFNKNLSFAKEHFDTKLSIHYLGFAYQNKGFDYHADSVWPENQDDRFLGYPTLDGIGYKNYQGNWIPNYVPTRKYTTVLYLNENFDGGETHFPTLDTLVKPKKNKIAGFGCSEKYVHGVMPTTNGLRKAFICWFE